jgi:glutamate/tyrosine decarboxylase-like PLP-dependent enzyme
MTPLLERIEKGFNSMGSRIDNLEYQVKKLADKESNNGQCRYSLDEEKRLEKLLDQQVDESIQEVNAHGNMAVEQIDQAARKAEVNWTRRIEDNEQHVMNVIEESVATMVGEVLEHAPLQISGTIFIGSREAT